MNLVSPVKFKRVLQSLVLGFLCLSLTSSSFAALEIVEYMNNPNGDDRFWEWIEVRNTTGSPIDLKGYLGVNLNDSGFDPNDTGINGTIFGDFGSGPVTDTVIPAGGVAVIYDGFDEFGEFPGENYDPNKFYQAWGLDPNTTVVMPTDFWPGLSNSSGSSNQSIAFYAPDPGFNSALDGFKVSDRWPTYLADVTDTNPDPNIDDFRVTSFANAAFSLNYSDPNVFPVAGQGESVHYKGTGDITDGANWALSADSDASGAFTSIEIQAERIGTDDFNSADDLGSPGVVPNTPTSAGGGLIFSEILYDPGIFDGFDDIPWEWVEVYNSSLSTINVTGWVLDDINGNAHSGANVNVDPNSSYSGDIPSGTAAVLFNGDLDPNIFLAAWDPNGTAGINIIPVSGWTSSLMGLNNGGNGDQVALWDDPNAYNGDNAVHANAVVTQQWGFNNGFVDPSQGPSINLADLTLDPNDPQFWATSNLGDGYSYNATGVPDPNSTGLAVLHVGGDIGSPGTFIVQTGGIPGDFNNDGRVDADDFLEWQRNPSLGNLADWEANYGTPVTANATAVPEPSTLFLVIGSLASLGLQRRRQS